MIRFIPTIVVLAHFALVPALCQLGMVQHACAEDVEAACAHEEDCQSDPCSDAGASLAKEATRDVGRQVVVGPVPLSAILPPALSRGPARCSATRQPALAPTLQRTLPLLV
jgi:hypothetical protein